MKLFLFRIDVAPDAHQTVFVPLQNGRIRDFPIRVEIRQQGPSVIADLDWTIFGPECLPSALPFRLRFATMFRA